MFGASTTSSTSIPRSSASATCSSTESTSTARWLRSGLSGSAGLTGLDVDERAANLQPSVADALETEGLPGRSGAGGIARDEADVVEVELHRRRRLDDDDPQALPEIDFRRRPSSELHAQPDVAQRARLARPLGLEQGQLAVTGIRADQRKTLRPLDHVHPELFRRDLDDPVALGHPERDVIERPGLHLRSVYFFRSTARCSWALFIFDRPSMPIRFASL